MACNFKPSSETSKYKKDVWQKISDPTLKLARRAFGRTYTVEKIDNKNTFTKETHTKKSKYIARTLFFLLAPLSLPSTLFGALINRISRSYKKINAEKNIFKRAQAEHPAQQATPPLNANAQTAEQRANLLPQAPANPTNPTNPAELNLGDYGFEEDDDIENLHAADEDGSNDPDLQRVLLNTREIPAPEDQNLMETAPQTIEQALEMLGMINPSPTETQKTILEELIEGYQTDSSLQEDKKPSFKEYVEITSPEYQENLRALSIAEHQLIDPNFAVPAQVTTRETLIEGPLTDADAIGLQYAGSDALDVIEIAQEDSGGDFNATTAFQHMIENSLPQPQPSINDQSTQKSDAADDATANTSADVPESNQEQPDLSDSQPISEPASTSVTDPVWLLPKGSQPTLAQLISAPDHIIIVEHGLTKSTMGAVYYGTVYKLLDEKIGSVMVLERIGLSDKPLNENRENVLNEAQNRIKNDNTKKTLITLSKTS